ncbi:sphingosine-1-phosphate phosphohydrolase [Arthroderma uncinatum]|uniref:sphingosine-1-phosphate phosphohydrolase n=1 Tax=Arthroderma uncinatum TaxID=74035 RepID=UPI00144AA7B4|nr:sphingosine-1-phosphate phosphohydrolase [Arthroderma uncinatum]KAF3482186.1 sphingosine-1-phosphate phosphohydrolase [Arthroderma uncinatum]
MDKGKGKTDAGLKSLNHYQKKLPAWRYTLRQNTLPLVRWETPYLAWLQERMRTPSLDSWFAITANLGTHTFYMVMLPILFWSGYTGVGRAVVHLLAAGVFFSGFMKDLLCLPRPLSPPLQRITMSGSAALEYGFPSTHSTNAVSIVVYALHSLQSQTDLSPLTSTLLQTGLYIYVTSIVIGRLYCGMHGFLDVVVGSILGALLGFVQCFYGPTFDDYLFSGGIQEVFIIFLVIIVLVRVHPEPADSCPCFDDSVAFAGVFAGVELGNWHFARSIYSLSVPTPGTVPFDLRRMGWIIAILRIVIGVLSIVVWREVMKPALLRFLPPLFRIIERLGLSLPRRFFKRATEYNRIPNQLKYDDVMPNVSDIPSMLTSIRHPRRRAISIGPQSEADAYEAIAYRQQRRRTSAASENQPPSPLPEKGNQSQNQTPTTRPKRGISNASQPRSPSRSLDDYEHMMGTSAQSYEEGGAKTEPFPNGNMTNDALEAEEEKDMFSKITPPRVRYDVEVVTKLIVYSGIGLLAVEGSPMLFHFLGLD